MTTLLPNAESVGLLVSQFESDLAGTRSARDAQEVRDRYLGRE